MPKALIEIVGDAEAFALSIKRSISSVSTFKGELRSLNVDVKKSAEAQVKASVLRTSRIREEMTAVRELASTYKRGSQEQIAAMQLVARKQAELNRLQGAATAGGLRRGRGGIGRDEREASGLIRGGLHGAGVGGLGLSALAGGTFFGAFVGASAVRTTIKAATDAQAIEKQLGAQYKANGQALGDYRGQIDKTFSRLSALAGFNKDELAQSYTTIYRASGNTAASLKDEAAAANLARGRHMDLQAAALLEAKVINGNVGILKRYGIETWKGETATQALAAISAKYAGQAAAGTTAQQRFSAELHNSEVIIGTALLPTVSHLLGEGAKWLDQMNRSGRLQRDVNAAVKDGKVVVGLLKDGVALLRGGIHLLDGVTGGFKQTLELLLALKVGSKLSGWAGDFGLMRSKTKGAADEVSTLRGRLKNLAALGTVVVTVDVLERFIPKHVTAQGQKVLDQGGGGALGKIPIIGPVIQAGAAYGRDTRNAIFGSGTAGSKYTKTELEAYLSGKQRDAFPFPLTDPAFTADFAAYQAGRKAAGDAIGSKKNTKPPAGASGKLPPLHTFALPDAIQNDLARALTPAQDKKAAEQGLAYTQKLLNSGRLVGAAYTDALKERKKLYAEIARDAKKLTGHTGGSLLPASVQGDLAAAQGAAASKSLPALKALQTEQEKALTTLRGQHDVGADRVKQLKEEAALQRQIASTAKQITAAETSAAKAADARTAHRILGIGAHPRLSAIQTIQASERKTLNDAVARGLYGDKATKQQIASVTRKTANLGLAGLTELVRREWGDKLPKATLDSLEKVNKVLALKFLPPDVLTNIRGRLQQIKATIQGGLAGINQTANGYRGVSADEFVKGIPGLTRAQRVALEERYSQVEAHGGRPTGPAIAGMPTHGGSVIHIANLHVTGVENLDHLITQIEKRTRHKVQRGGVRR